MELASLPTMKMSTRFEFILVTVRRHYNSSYLTNETPQTNNFQLLAFCNLTRCSTQSYFPFAVQKRCIPLVGELNNSSVIDDIENLLGETDLITKLVQAISQVQLLTDLEQVYNFTEFIMCFSVCAMCSNNQNSINRNITWNDGRNYGLVEKNKKTYTNVNSHCFRNSKVNTFSD